MTWHSMTSHRAVNLDGNILLTAQYKFRGRIIGVRIFCTNAPCLCAGRNQAICRCGFGLIRASENTPSLEVGYGRNHTSLELRAGMSGRLSSLQPYAMLDRTRAYTASTSVSAHTPAHAPPSDPVDSLGQAQDQIEQNIRFVGAQFEGVVPPPAPSPDILTSSQRGSEHDLPLFHLDQRPNVR